MSPNPLNGYVERGDCSAMSCGFIVARDEWDADMEHRTVQSFSEFLDVSAVTYPASPTTALAVARRMALQIPVASRARARQIYVDVRSGKTLNSKNQGRIISATKNLHDVLADAGVDASELSVWAGSDGTTGSRSAAKLKRDLDARRHRRPRN
jgi:Caudovirus prohead serine protease